MPDERARLRADEGHARLARLRARPPSATSADLILFNTCSIRESADNRFIAHLGEAKRLKSEDPERVVGVGGCWAQSVKDEVFERFPFVDVAFGPGPDPPPGRVPHLGLADRPGLLRVRGLLRAPADEARARVPGLGADLAGLQLRLLLLHRALDPRAARQSRDPDELVAEVERLAADGVREVTLLGQNVNSYGRDLPTDEPDQLRRAARAGRRGRRDRADPLHEPAPQGHARGRDPRPRRAAVALRAHPPAAAVGLEPDPEGDAPHLRPRALPGPRGADPRARPRLRDHHRHHRRLPGRDRGGLRARRSRSSTRSATTAPSPSSSRPRRGTEAADARRTRSRTRSSASAWSAWSSWSSAAPASAPQRFVGRTMEVLVEGPSRTDPTRLRGRTRHNKTVNFDGTAAPGELVEVEIDGGDLADADRARAAAQPRPLSPAPMQVLAIFGPTAVGKTGVAIALAELLRERGEDPVAVNCDSIQVYRGPRGRSAAPPTPSERERARASAARRSSPVDEEFSAGRFAELAHAEIDALLARGPAADRGRRHRPLPARGARRARPAAAGAGRGPRARSRRELAERGPGGAARRARPRARRGVHPNDRKRIARLTELAAAGIEPPRAASEGSGRRSCATRPCWSGLTIDRERAARADRRPGRRDGRRRARRRRRGAADARRRLAHRARGARLRGAARRRRRGDEARRHRALRPPPAHLDAQDGGRRADRPHGRERRRGRRRDRRAARLRR